MDGVVLVLNQNYEPLNVCNLPRAFRLLFGERAEVIEYDHQVIRTPRTEYRAPSVIRLQHLIRRPRPRVKLSRREVFVRDHHTCQYCGRQSHDLTLDHVVPRHRGGGHTWDNLVTACKPCNHRKGGKTLGGDPLPPQPSAVRAAQRRVLALHAVPGRRPQRRVALVPVPGSELIAAEAVVERRIADVIPGPVVDVLRTLWTNGHAAYVVGGSVRDVVLGREPYDWDLATDARPDRVQELFPGAVYENRFGTVAVRPAGHRDVQVTTFRQDHDYADFRRPHRVEFGDTIESDLARRDFTVNAMAWGADAGGPAPGETAGHRRPARRSRRRRGSAPARGRRPADPLRGGRAADGPRRSAVGDPRPRRGRGDPRRASRRGPRSSSHLSGERIAIELDKLLAAPTPSVGLRLLSDSDLLVHLSPDLAAQRGIAQNKVPGEDLWDHTLRAVDAVRPDHPVVRLATLLHDIGKPATLADGHFIGHDSVGADLAGAFLDRLRSPRSVRDRVVHLVRHHMFSYEPHWSDAAVRRFILKIGHESIEELFELREADNVGSGPARRCGPVSSTSCGRASARRSRPRPCSTCAAWPSTART